jgi:hypothetical protein
VTLLAGAATADHRRISEVLRQAMIARIVTVSADLKPLIMPLYFVVIDGRASEPRYCEPLEMLRSCSYRYVLVLFQVRDGELVRLRGTTPYLHDTATIRRVARATLPKYVLRPRALWFWLRHLSRIPTRSQYIGERSGSGMIEVTPESYTVTSA